MVATARPISVARMSTHRPTPPFIAADVGGTHVRIGLVEATGDARAPVRVLHYTTYACAQWPGLGEIVEDFLSTLTGVPVDSGVIASAGYALDDGTVITVNLPWPISLATLRERLGFRDFRLVNDFEAVAHAAAHVDASEVMHLTGPDSAPPGPTLVLGPGTGLGAAVWIPTPRGPVVLATEAGQAALTATTERETEVLHALRHDRSHVAIEHALSGPGLVNLYRALARVDGETVDAPAPDAITAAAQSGHDPRARETLDLFCGLLGSTVGDMALLYGISGGIHLAGGILPRIRDTLAGSRFVERFLDKGPMREALRHIPVKLVEHGQLGVVGAANWYLAQGREA